MTQFKPPILLCITANFFTLSAHAESDVAWRASTDVAYTIDPSMNYTAAPLFDGAHFVAGEKPSGALVGVDYSNNGVLYGLYITASNTGSSQDRSLRAVFGINNGSKWSIGFFTEQTVTCEGIVNAGSSTYCTDITNENNHGVFGTWRLHF